MTVHVTVHTVTEWLCAQWQCDCATVTVYNARCEGLWGGGAVSYSVLGLKSVRGRGVLDLGVRGVFEIIRHDGAVNPDFDLVSEPIVSVSMSFYSKLVLSQPFSLKGRIRAEGENDMDCNVLESMKNDFRIVLSPRPDILPFLNPCVTRATQGSLKPKCKKMSAGRTPFRPKVGSRGSEWARWLRLLAFLFGNGIKSIRHRQTQQ